ncbi:heterokaryon incompatibility protein-domain-containing protein [Cercophora newfieldiana]|uniref:Heterokaryon incompatibility protein-domain-containing protein n=1 Tax=Cercophora newfieldiana TaxID=92897 RepID=A0AA40CT60_9PEZI|nr:heterokaryon incompatibility protein-domain-containing protein [Cercophora newfieldiana]
MADSRSDYRDGRFEAPRQYLALSRTGHASSSEDERPRSRYESRRTRTRATRSHQQAFEGPPRARSPLSSEESDDDPGPRRFKSQRPLSPPRTVRRHEEVREVRRDSRWEEDDDEIDRQSLHLYHRERERDRRSGREKNPERAVVKDRGTRRKNPSHVESSDELHLDESDEDPEPARDFRFVDGGPPPPFPSSASEHSRFETPPELDRGLAPPERTNRPPPAPSAPIEIRRRSTNVRELPYRSSPLSRSPGMAEVPKPSPSKHEAQLLTGSPGNFSQRVGTPLEMPPGSWQPSSSHRGSVVGDRQHQYRPLDESFIRLIRILPERKTMLRCELVHVSLRKPPRYVAISYAWGDAGDTRKIELEGSLVPISVSLHGALTALRQKSESVMVWADALSIDQSNDDEKTQQIQLMPSIFASADSVAVWLGPEKDDSTQAIGLLCDLASHGSPGLKLADAVSSSATRRALQAVVPLFQRDYWKRLWVVQEIFNAKDITVYCGPTKVSWDVYQDASMTFRSERHLLERHIRVGNGRYGPTTDQFTYPQVLVSGGPASLPNLRPIVEHTEEPLLEILRACRRKLASDPKDKLFGVLGILPQKVRNEFRADYSLSLKEIYTEIVDYILKTTEKLDVICDAIHFPVHTSSANLPSFVPDWSHIPQSASMSHWDAYGFRASGDTRAICRFLDDRLNKLEISAIDLGTVKVRGSAVGTLCTCDDFILAFLQWRALLLQTMEHESDKGKIAAEQHFAKALCLGQVLPQWERPKEWLAVCYHLFASMLQTNLPYVPLDQDLLRFLDMDVDIPHSEHEVFLDKNFGSRMMGRCFFRTEEGRIGMGSGFMAPDDVVVVPLGCSTPILLRETGTRGEYRFVGDVYIHGYMEGKAVHKWRNGDAELKKYVLV